MARRKRDQKGKFIKQGNLVSDDIFIPNHSGMLDAGKVHRVPTDDLDPVNKEYVDAQFPVKLDEIANPSGDTLFNMANKTIKFRFVAPTDNAFEIELSGGFQGDGLHIHQHTGNPGAGTHLAHFEAEDADVLPLCLVHPTQKQLRISQEVNVKFVDFTVDSSDNLTIDPNGTGKVIINSELDMNTHKITALTDGSDPQDAATFTQLHAESHSLASHSTKDHSELTSVTTDQHHPQTHTIVSHDTTATGTELNTLTGGGDTTLHDHDGISENTAARHEILTTSDGTTISFTLANQEISAETIDAQIDHDSLKNFVGDEHINWKIATVNFDTSGTGRFGSGVTITKNDNANFIELGQANTNQFAVFDLKGDSTWSDFGGRLLRGNGGANTTTSFDHRGTGALLFRAVDAGSWEVQTNSASRIAVDSSGGIVFTLGDLPTSDPSTAGQLWRSGTDLKISAG